MIEQLEVDASDQLAAIPGAKARACVSVTIAGKPVTVYARRTHRGATALGYGYCGVRLERAMLLLLICPETACPHGEAARSM